MFAETPVEDRAEERTGPCPHAGILPFATRPRQRPDNRGFPTGPEIRRIRIAASNPLEMLVQFLAGEDQGRGAAVGAVVGIVNQVPLLQERGNLFRG